MASVNRFNLLLKQDSGMPRRDTVVSGTKQSGKNQERFLMGSLSDPVVVLG